MKGFFMKKAGIIFPLCLLLLGISGCQSQAKQTPSTDQTQKVVQQTKESSKKQIKAEKEESTKESTVSNTSSTTAGKTTASEEAFKQLMSDVAYNKEYLTDDQKEELKVSQKEMLTEEQYKQFVALLDKE